MVLRSAAVAGQFYPAGMEELKGMLDRFFSKVGKSERDSSVVIAPHAGYVYSGKIAAYSFSSLRKADTYFVLSPNHTGWGSEVSIFPPGEWRTPFGKISVDKELSESVAEQLGLEFDESAHVAEHSLEVELPFLQYCFSEFKIVAITIANHDLEMLKKIGHAIFDSAKGKDVAVVASSDFTHQEPEETAKQKDLEAIGRIEKIDIDGFYDLVLGKRLSICGFAPIVSAMAFAEKKGLKKGVLLKYGSSADETGDSASVVGYAGIKFL